MAGEMRALSIKQPWASAIASGPKRVENREWMTPAWIFGKTIALHASASPDWQAPERAWTAAGIAPYRRGARHAPWLASLTLGTVVAVAVISECHPPYRICNPGGPESVCSPWAVWGQCHWVLDGVRPLAEPVPCRGALGLWRLPGDVEEAVRKQMESSHAR